MIRKLIVILLLCGFVNSVKAQTNITSKSQELYITPWLVNFADTLQAYTNNKSISSNTYYTFVRKIKGKQYKAFLFKNKGSNDSRLIDEKLKIKFKKHQWIVRLGKQKVKYIINRRTDNKLVLLKQRKK